jgi:hypothetical protein
MCLVLKLMGGFREISDCPKWLINDKGDVWSANKGGLLSPHQNGTGYLQLLYHNHGKRKKHYVHRLVARAFIGEIPEGYCVNHIDGNKHNNSLSNLEIVTRKRNNDHAVQVGLRKRWRGDLHPQSKLNENKVKEIRRRADAGELFEIIANDFTISKATVYDLQKRRSWRWLA